MNSKLYRCGWCGNVTDSTGGKLEDTAKDKAIRLHETLPTEAHTVLVDGYCCTQQLEAANHNEECPSCYGSGEWEAECCNGSGGCSCRGQAVNMGRCNVCNGTGRVTQGKYNARANSDFILRSGCCFLGTGPSTGYWSTTPAMGIIN